MPAIGDHGQAWPGMVGAGGREAGACNHGAGIVRQVSLPQVQTVEKMVEVPYAGELIVLCQHVKDESTCVAAIFKAAQFFCAKL